MYATSSCLFAVLRSGLLSALPKPDIIGQDLPEHYRYSSAASYENQPGPLSVTLLEDIWDDMGYVG